MPLGHNVVIDEKLAEVPLCQHNSDMVAVSIDFEHARRSRRLLAILVDRFGVAHFLDGQRGQCVNLRACEDAVALARAWIERRTGREVAADITGMMRRDLQRILEVRMASDAVCKR